MVLPNNNNNNNDDDDDNNNDDDDDNNNNNDDDDDDHNNNNNNKIKKKTVTEDTWDYFRDCPQGRELVSPVMSCNLYKLAMVSDVNELQMEKNITRNYINCWMRAYPKGNLGDSTAGDHPHIPHQSS